MDKIKWHGYGTQIVQPGVTGCHEASGTTIFPNSDKPFRYTYDKFIKQMIQVDKFRVFGEFIFRIKIGRKGEQNIEKYSKENVNPAPPVQNILDSMIIRRCNYIPKYHQEDVRRFHKWKIFKAYRS